MLRGGVSSDSLLLWMIYFMESRSKYSLLTTSVYVYFPYLLYSYFLSPLYYPLLLCFLVLEGWVYVPFL